MTQAKKIRFDCDGGACDNGNSEVVQLSDVVFMFPSRNIGCHDNVFQGEIRSQVRMSRSCVIKFATLSQQNVNEAKILTDLGSHSNVIALIQSGVYHDLIEEHFYLALDKCHHENLRQFYANRRETGIEFDVNQAMEYAKQIVNGVGYLHDNRVIHLDLKPSNILLSLNLTLIKIADFGLSVRLESGQSQLFLKCQFGTNGYRPIESLGNSWVSFRTDIFSLGTLLFNLLTNGKEVFGYDGHVYIDNVINDVTDTFGLLVSNPRTAENLIKCMIRQERRRRPNIQQVVDHPFWTGMEVDRNFDYVAEDESDRCDVNQSEVCKKQTSTGKTSDDVKFLQAARSMGFNRKLGIIIFDRNTTRLQSVDLESRTVCKMQSYSKVEGIFRAASLGEYVYVFKQDRTVYRLEYGDAFASWERRADMLKDLGFWPPVAASESSIYVSSGDNASAGRLVIRFDPSGNKWNSLPDKKAETGQSTILATGKYLYCFGGSVSWPIQKETDFAERVDLSTMTWEDIAEMPTARCQSSAVECENKIYVVGGSGIYQELLDSVEVYNPYNNQWNLMKTINIPRYFLCTFLVDGKLYVVGGGHEVGVDQPIEMYDFQKDKWDVIMVVKNMEVWNSVPAKLSF